MLKKLLKKVKGADHLDIILIEAATFFITLLLISLVPAIVSWARRQNKLMLLGIAAVLMARPAYKCWKAKQAKRSK